MAISLQSSGLLSIKHQALYNDLDKPLCTVSVFYVTITATNKNTFGDKFNGRRMKKKPTNLPLHPFTSRRSTTQGRSTDLILTEIYFNIYSNKIHGFLVCTLVLQYQSCDLFESTYSCHLRLLTKENSVMLRVAYL